MFSTSSPASAGSALGSSEPACEPSPSAKVTNIAKPCCEGTGQMSLFGMTCEPSPFTKDGLLPTPSSDASLRQRKYAQGGKGLGYSIQLMNTNVHQCTSMSSAAVSPVRTYQSPEKARALRASAAAYGRSSPELLARYDRDTQSWRTSQLCLDGDYQLFSETWPRSGIQAAGTVSLPLPSGHRIVEIESGS
jgi:hypothetical protein